MRAHLWRDRPYLWRRAVGDGSRLRCPKFRFLAIARETSTAAPAYCSLFPPPAALANATLDVPSAPRLHPRRADTPFAVGDPISFDAKRNGGKKRVDITIRQGKFVSASLVPLCRCCVAHLTNIVQISENGLCPFSGIGNAPQCLVPYQLPMRHFAGTCAVARSQTVQPAYTQRIQRRTGAVLRDWRITSAPTCAAP